MSEQAEEHLSMLLRERKSMLAANRRHGKPIWSPKDLRSNQAEIDQTRARLSRERKDVAG